ncbi:hypothetical protein G7Z17_g7055 [Cylindrodendrum hubeiense]|uniref:hydroxymethylglutaryl-CoA lyase n=1 Tax=Cylindrodendrum hubeiense TaxID=595255 RepID=A0A9P5H9S6_9HYPO|nr:hypothetical protein G7Z17_g7055 [Cylindrodendrum hubeiense]
MNPNVRIVEVGPRDGLQNISQKVPTNIKIDLICKLYDTGLRAIEITSVVSPKAVPQLSDCRDVLKSSLIQELLQNKSLRLPVLIPNIKGIEIGSQYGISEVAVFISATEGFSKANINCTVDEGIARARSVAQEAQRRGLAVRGYVSCIFTDPFDGPTSPTAVLKAVNALIGMGCYEISLGDTLGVGSPSNTRKLIKFLDNNGVPLNRLAGHFHDTYGQAVANVWEAYNCGIRVFDSSVAGLGGCPFAPGAKGNVATEDLVYMFDKAGIETGVDLSKLVTTGTWISQKLSMQTGSRAGAALASKSKPENSKNIETGALSAKASLSWTCVNKTDGLLVHRAGANLKITMNRPKNGNALTVTMINDLISTFKEAGKDPTLSRIVITGTGKFFCTGMDLGKNSTPVGADVSAADAQFERLYQLFETIDTCPKVTISCLNGPAFGGGVGLAFTCDIRLCIQSATVTLSEAKLGLCPATISKYVIREWGIPFSREAMLSSRPVSPTELKAKGVIFDVADDAASLDKLLTTLLLQLRVTSSDATRMCKDLVRAGWAHGGQQEQAVVIKQLFQDMMKPGAPGDYGVKEFQAGRKVDWDEYHKNKSRSKL